MFKIIERVIRRIKGNDFILDKNISITYIFSKILLMSLNIIRGNIKSLFVKKKNLMIFIGSRSKLIMRKKITLGSGINIGSYVTIDALSNNGVILGNNVKIGDFTRIMCTGTIRNLGEGMIIGDNCGIAENCFFGAAGGIEIGNDVIIGQNVRFHSENHNFNDLSVLIRLQGVSQKGIKIGNDCWIGSGATFLDGAQLGDGCVVAANSVVTKNFPNNSVIAGVPAKIIRKRG
jgi:acetyltransferase-like isoleucine patch superfamily enzyme